MQEVIIDGIKIDVRSNKSLYITIGDYVYYIDDSTNEQIMEKWMPDYIKTKNFIRALEIGSPELAKSYYKKENNK